jgi:hypothetical protein
LITNKESILKNVLEKDSNIDIMRPQCSAGKKPAEKQDRVAGLSLKRGGLWLLRIGGRSLPLLSAHASVVEPASDIKIAQHVRFDPRFRRQQLVASN